MRLGEAQGSLDREEDRKEACHSQAVEEQNHPFHRSQEQRPGYLGNHEAHQDLGSEPVAGSAAAAGQEGNRKEEGRAAVADHGMEAAVG
jgi:hypothetical protein